MPSLTPLQSSNYLYAQSGVNRAFPTDFSGRPSLPLPTIELKKAPALVQDAELTQLDFRWRTQKVETRSADVFKKIPSKVIKVKEPRTQTEISFMTYALTEVLEVVYGKTWKDAEEILLISKTGEIKRLTASHLKEQEGYLASRRTDSNDFNLSYQVPVGKYSEERRLFLGPFFLIWASSPNEAKTEDLWLHQISRIDLGRCLPLESGEKSPAGVKRGEALFRVHCTSCHQLNGFGSITAGTDFSKSILTQNYPEAGVRYFIKDPSRVRLGATMPNYKSYANSDTPDEDVLHMIDYLRWMIADPPKAKVAGEK